MRKLFIFFKVIFIATVIMLPVYFSANLCRYDVLTVHDLVYPYGRTFFEPEHGRYLATFINSLFTEVIPETFNLHPNDFQVWFMGPFKGFCLVFICLFFANAFFLFKRKDDNRSLLRIPFSNPIFLLTYLTVFILFFNQNYLTVWEDVHWFGIFENMIFFEYPMSLPVYFIFFSLYGYYFVTGKPINKPDYIFLLIFAFAAGLTVEPLNLPALVCLCFLGFALLLRGKKSSVDESSSDERGVSRKGFSISSIFIYISFLIGIICYYIRPSGHSPDYGELTFIEYAKTNIIPYLKGYYEYYVRNHSLFVLPSVASCIAAFCIPGKREYAKRLSVFFLSSVASFFIFYLAVFFIGRVNDFYWFDFGKWIWTYKAVLVFLFLFTTGYFLDMLKGRIGVWTSRVVKILILLTLFIVFGNPTKYFDRYNGTLNWYKGLRQAEYITEKIALETKSGEIRVPYSFAEYEGSLSFPKESCSYDVFINLLYPDLHKDSVVYIDDEEAYAQIELTEDELKEPKYKNIVKKPFKRYKKHIEGCY